MTVARSEGYRGIPHPLITETEYSGDRLDGLSTENHRFHHPHTVKNTRYAQHKFHWNISQNEG